MGKPVIIAVTSLLFFNVGSSALADDWGCEVLLCLSNPAGPMAVSECVPPISRLYREMKRRHFKFPTCDLVSDSNTPKDNSSARAQLTNNIYASCPTGTSELSAGAYALHGKQMYVGIGSGYPADYSQGELPSKTCVGGNTRNVTVKLPGGSVTTSAAQYDNVVSINPRRIIEVYVDGKPYQEVRY